jgi:hypothetical protein
MNKKLAFPVALALLAVAVPAVTAAPKPAQKLSIAAKPAAVTFGQETLVSGQLTGGTAKDISGQNIALQSDPYPYDGAFGKVATVDTNNAGFYSFKIKPLTNARYRTLAKGGTESAQLTVPVRVAITLAVSDKTPSSGARVKFSGTIAPPHDGKVARIQRRASGRWKTVAKTTLTDGGDVVSNFSKRVRITRSGRYRVHFSPGDGDHAKGNSRGVRITVG